MRFTECPTCREHTLPRPATPAENRFATVRPAILEAGGAWLGRYLRMHGMIGTGLLNFSDDELAEIHAAAVSATCQSSGQTSA